MKEIIVPDASVVLKWAFDAPDERDKEKALSLLNAWIDGKCEIVLPKLWSYEVGNVLMMKIPEQAHEVMEIFLGYDFTEYEMSLELCKETYKLMQRFNITFYDAVYQAVAFLQKGKLLTADESYRKKVGDIKYVMSLRDWDFKF
jgi:predicted nucleic acid-binding protein